MLATSVLVTAILPLVLALVGGGAVAFYMAKPNKDSIVMATTERAVAIVGATIDRQEKENAAQLKRITVLEEELRKAATAAAAAAVAADAAATACALQVTSLTTLVDTLRKEISRMEKM